MKEKLRRFFAGDGISKPAYHLMRCGLMLCCLLLTACLILCVYAGPPCIQNRRLYALASQLYREPQSVLLIVSLGALCVDGLIKRGM